MALPIAASQSPGILLSAVWFGMVGGGFPDWIDLRSDFRHRLKHRGVSHSILLGALLTAGLATILGILAEQFSWIAMTSEVARVLPTAFAAGFLSHIIADSCTVSGVQPLLPLTRVRWWSLPPFLRGRSSGGVDGIVRIIAVCIIAVYVWQITASRFAMPIW